MSGAQSKAALIDALELMVACGRDEGDRCVYCDGDVAATEYSKQRHYSSCALAAAQAVLKRCGVGEDR